MNKVILWILLTLVTGVLMGWVARVDWATLYRWYLTLPRPSARVPALALAAAVVLVLQIAAILLVAGHMAIPSLITGWLLAVTVVCLILRWPRVQ